jgi:quinol monooxygenase YgiN
VSVVVVATIIPLPEHRDEVIAALTQTIPKVHAEDGCELYALHQAADRLVMIEKWASSEALATHSRGAALAAMNPQLKGKVTGSAEVIVLQAVPAGDPPKGEL